MTCVKQQASNILHILPVQLNTGAFYFAIRAQSDPYVTLGMTARGIENRPKTVRLCSPREYM